MKQLSIAGRIGRDAELRTLQSGTSACRFTVAVDSRKGSEKVTTWVACTIFGKRAEALAKFLTKGAAVAAVGDLEVRTYQKDGETKVDVGIVVSEITLLGGGERSATPAGPRTPPGSSGGGGFGVDDFGDVPF